MSSSPERVWHGICTATDGCVLHSDHVGECKIAKMEEEEYEVEVRLVDKEEVEYLGM